MNMNDSYTEELKAKIIGLGANLVGVAGTEPLRQLETHPSNLLEPFRSAVSIGIVLPRAVFDQITDRPTPTYSSVYRTANRFLDQMALVTANVLERGGFNSLPVPASQTVDLENHRAAISHKAVGRMAGLGWQGKSLLLVNPEYGPRIRLVTVLTEAFTKGVHVGARDRLLDTRAARRENGIEGGPGCKSDRSISKRQSQVWKKHDDSPRAIESTRRRCMASSRSTSSPSVGPEDALRLALVQPL